MSHQFSNICDSEITAVCIDSRGRKFFIGNHHGEVKVNLKKKFKKKRHIILEMVHL